MVMCLSLLIYVSATSEKLPELKNQVNAAYPLGLYVQSWKTIKDEKL